MPKEPNRKSPRQAILDEERLKVITTVKINGNHLFNPPKNPPAKPMSSCNRAWMSQNRNSLP